MCADIRLVQPVACPWEADVPMEGVVRREVLRNLDIAETLAQLQDHVESLTLAISDLRIDELPMRLHHHTTSVPSRWTRLLCMIA